MAEEQGQDPLTRMSNSGSFTLPQTDADITEEGIDRAIAVLTQLGIMNASLPEWRQSLDEALVRVSAMDELWVFGYGSLMWNPGFAHDETLTADLPGFHRAFCLNIEWGRGTADNPGLMLALDNGGHTKGKALRVSDNAFKAATTSLWVREMLTGAYKPHWGTVETDQGHKPSLTFVVNHQSERYLGKLPLEEAARRIGRAKGLMGANFDYIDNMVIEFEKHGIKDDELIALHRAAKAHYTPE